MRIVYFLSEFPKLSETFILNQIEGLLDLGHDLRIVALGTGDLPVHPAVERRRLLERTTYLPAVPGSRLRRALSAVPRAAAGLVRVPSVVAGALRADRYGRIASSLELFYRATAVRDALDADVVHCHYGPMGRLAVILREIGAFDAPIVTTFHGYDLRLGAELGPAAFEPLQRLGDATIAISRWSRSRLVELGFDPQSLVDHPVGVSLDRTARRGAGARSAEVRLLTVARLVPEKGLDGLLEALAAVREDRDCPSWSHRIVGAGPLESSLRARITALGLDGFVELVGAADREAVDRELAAADLFVLPSDAEVLPVAVMEAHAAGVPVVASDVGATGEIVEHGRSGLLVPPGDRESLARAIAALVADESRRRAYGERGRAIVAERYEIGELCRRLQNVLHSVVERRAAL